MRALFILLTGLFLGSATAAPGKHAIATAHPLATQAGAQMLKAGGNAFDAAVAISAALAVVEPTGSGFGGGGFWLLHRASDGEEIFLDGREMAPAASSADMYLDEKGKAIASLSRDGALAAGIPGQAAALVLLSRKYGRLPLSRSLAPAIAYARQGFVCDEKLAGAFAAHWSRMNDEAREVFALAGKPPRSGGRIVQLDLAQSLERLAEKGFAGFYEGPTAERLVNAVRGAGGIWTRQDLRNYRALERAPVEIFFRTLRIVTAPPPSAGGITMAQVFGQLEALDWRDDDSAHSVHLQTEAMRRAYRDRARWLGDADFVRVPMKRLTSTSYSRNLARNIDPDKATPSAELPPAAAFVEGRDTTHFSVMDAQGNRVAATLSINLPFGSAFMAAGTGIVLNDEMDDFSASPDAANAYGLAGSLANRIEPGKRPLSSMSPSFVEGPRGVLVIGTPGGSRIITMVLRAILGWERGMDLDAVVARPRLHHQYLPDRLFFEPGALSQKVRDTLQGRGHVLSESSRQYGNMHAVSWNPGTGVVKAASDPRGVGEATVFDSPDSGAR